MHTPPTSCHGKTKGVTLIELAIVISIIGLLVGGIMVGRSLISAAQVQSVIKEYDGYLKALHEFNVKYHALPGDFLKATAIWGTDVAGCPNLSYTDTIPPDTLTCNGNGNGRIGATDGAGALSIEYEWWRAWQHLANARLIDGRYTGVRGSGGNGHANIGVNVPASKLKPAGWTLLYYQQTADTANLWGEPTGGYGHLLVLGAESTLSYTYEAAITPANAIEIDTKIDDGKPGSGKIRAPRTGLLSTCTATDTSVSSQKYNLRTNVPACSLIFILGI